MIWLVLITAALATEPLSAEGLRAEHGNACERLWPLFASMSVILTIVLMVLSSSDFHEYLGRPTSYSIGIMLTTIAFAVSSLVAVITVIKERRTAMNRVNYWYSACSSIIHLAMTLYLIRFGVIGIMFWS